MDSEVLIQMYSQIVGGLPKDQSKYVTDDESSKAWDVITEQVAEIVATGSGLDMVNEIPKETEVSPDGTVSQEPVTASASVIRARARAAERRSR
jgi:hypothetical protein